MRFFKPFIATILYTIYRMLEFWPQLQMIWESEISVKENYALKRHQKIFLTWLMEIKFEKLYQLDRN